MIVIVEGIDRVGKTTLVKMFEKIGFYVFKDENYLKAFDFNYDFSMGKLDTTIALIKQLSKDRNIVIDRAHLTEYAYGSVDRETNLDMIIAVDDALHKLGAKVIYVKPSNKELSFSLAQRDLSQHLAKFDEILQMTKLEVWNTIWELLEFDFIQFMKLNSEYDFYFASPFFRESQVEREEALKAKLRKLGYRVFSPKENCHLALNASQEDRQKIFEDNVINIKNSIATFAITDEKDMGTIWEAGCAYALKKPIIYFAETLGSNQFNLMLAQSGRAVFLNRDFTKEEIDAAVFKGISTKFEGVIE